MPLDISPAQSLENFKHHSMLCKRDIVLVLDGWLERLKRNELAIPLCDESKKVLERTVRAMHDHVMSNEIPDIRPELTGQEYRYELCWYHDGLQLGIERFLPGVVFDGSGEEYYEPVVFPEGQEPEEEEGCDPTEWYRLVHKVHVPLWPIDKWAELNDVRVPTARQWAYRDRIKYVKENGSMRVSSIQYTPDAARLQKDRPYRFQDIPQAPDGLAEKYPVLQGHIIDLLFVTKDDGSYGMLSGHVVDGKPKFELMQITTTEREEILEALYSTDGIRNVFDKYYVGPFGHDTLERNAQLTTCTTKEQAKFMRCLELKGSTKTMAVDDAGDRPGNVEPTVKFNVTATDPATGARLTFWGTYVIHDPTPEKRLIDAIFGHSEVGSRIQHAMADAGIARNKEYPWDRHVAFMDKIEIDEKFPDGVTALKNVHRMMERAVCLSPTLVFVPNGQIDETTATELGLESAGEYSYAYAPGRAYLKRFSEKKDD